MLSAAMAEEPIRLGLVFEAPEQGDVDPEGFAMRYIIEREVEALNASGGLLGRPVELLVRPDPCDERKARSIAKELTDAGAVAVIGHACSGGALGAATAYDRHQVLFITPSATVSTLTQFGYRTVFRMSGTDEQQGRVAGSHLADVFYGKRVAVVHDGSVFGRSIGMEVTKQLMSEGQSDALLLTFNPDAESFDTVVDSLVAQDPKALFVASSEVAGVKLLSALDRAGKQLPIMGSDAFSSPRFSEGLGGLSEGVRFTFVEDVWNRPPAAEAVAALTEEGLSYRGYVLHALAGFQVWAQAVARAGTTDGATVAGVMRVEAFDTVLGAIRFQDNGDLAGGTFHIYEWRQGEYAAQ